MEAVFHGNRGFRLVLRLAEHVLMMEVVIPSIRSEFAPKVPYNKFLEINFSRRPYSRRTRRHTQRHTCELYDTRLLRISFDETMSSC